MSSNSFVMPLGRLPPSDELHLRSKKGLTSEQGVFAFMSRRGLVAASHERPDLTKRVVLSLQETFEQNQAYQYEY